MAMFDGDYCSKAGSVRIEPDGTLTRFPGMSQDDRTEAINTLHDMQARNPQLLNNWAMGCI